MYRGTLIWWSPATGQGTAVVENIHYFILASRIISAPDEIRVGDYVEFKDYLKPRRENLLPLAVGIVISRKLDAGANALAKAGE